jgi:hypothetical protein
MAFIDDSVINRINSEARDVRFSRIMLTILAGLLYGVGWIAARVFGLIWLTLAWSVIAIKVGWQEGRKASVRPVVR